jgi:DNA-binding transcriptional MerR regulator/effector-binding domain-containing protein
MVSAFGRDFRSSERALRPLGMTENASMSIKLSIGDFSRMSHLSIKALRHYHDVGLLPPAEIDSQSGYRYYAPDQVATAQVIRRFRDLDMPVDEIKAVLIAPDPSSRNEVIVNHLERMQAQLKETEATVTSLRSLLDPGPTSLTIEYRSVPETPALAVADRVKAEDALEWWNSSFDDIYDTASRLGLEPVGAGGALFPAEFYEVEEADLVVFVSLAEIPPESSARSVPYTVPAAELAVATHRGAFDDIDRTYGTLGLHVAEQSIGVVGPMREYYLVTGRDTAVEADHRIEVGWPVFLTA